MLERNFWLPCVLYEVSQGTGKTLTTLKDFPPLKWEATGSGICFLFICLDANKFPLLSFFSLIKTIYLSVWTKPLPNDAKNPLPVDGHRSKTLLLKLLIYDNRPKPTWTVSQCVSWTKRREILGSSSACHTKQSYLPLPWCKHSPHRGRYLTHYTPDHQLYCPCRQHKALSIWRILLPRMDRFNRDNRKLKQPRRRQQRKREKRSGTTALHVHHTFSCKFLRRPPHDYDLKLSIKCEVL